MLGMFAPLEHPRRRVSVGVRAQDRRGMRHILPFEAVGDRSAKLPTDSSNPPWRTPKVTRLPNDSTEPLEAPARAGHCEPHACPDPHADFVPELGCCREGYQPDAALNRTVHPTKPANIKDSHNQRARFPTTHSAGPSRSPLEEAGGPARARAPSPRGARDAHARCVRYITNSLNRIRFQLQRATARAQL